MFSTNESLLNWLRQFAEPALVPMLAELGEEQGDQLLTIYNEHGQLGADFEIGELATALGRSVAAFMEVAKKAAFIDSGPAKKNFVVENVVALFRLANGGLDGKQQQFMASQAKHLPQAFPNGTETDLVRPLADEAVERCYDLMQKLANP